MLEGHFAQGNFDSSVKATASKLVDATIDLHRNVSNALLPSAKTFHYQFNLRELSNITQVPYPTLLPAAHTAADSLAARLFAQPGLDIADHCPCAGELRANGDGAGPVPHGQRPAD